jgi:hypothetical protein
VGPVASKGQRRNTTFCWENLMARYQLESTGINDIKIDHKEPWREVINWIHAAQDSEHCNETSDSICAGDFLIS